MADWKTRLSPASFRGEGFKIQTSDLSSGRRTVEHSFPGKDNPFYEDLGRGIRGFRIEGIVIGDDYFDKRDSLLSACEKEGPGELSHPYFGLRRVVCRSVEIREDTREGRFARISMTFSETRAPVFPISESSVIDSVEDASGGVEVAIKASFVEKYTVSGLPEFVKNDASLLAVALANQIDIIKKALK